MAARTLPSARRRWTNWSMLRGQRQTCATNNSCDCETGLKNVLPVNSSPVNSKARRSGSFRAASILASRSALEDADLTPALVGERADAFAPLALAAFDPET